MKKVNSLTSQWAWYSDACVCFLQCVLGLVDCRISAVFHQHSFRSSLTEIYCYWWQ